MTLRHTPRLPASLLALALACGGDGDNGFSASGAGTNSPTSATTPEQPTTGGSGGQSAGDTTTAGSASASHGDSSDGGLETGAATSAGSTTDVAGTGSSSTAPPAESSGTTAPVGEPEPCQVEMTQVSPIPPSVLFLLDKSGSMGDLPDYLWDHDNDANTPKVTRWSSLHAVVESMLDKFNDTVDFGAKLYPKKTATPYKAMGACEVDEGVEVEIAPMNAANILAVIPTADTDVLGGTPMEGGVQQAFNYLTALDADDQKFIVMIADGDISSTCDDQDFNEVLYYIETAWDEHDIGTYVVGIAIDDMASKTQLSMIANLGGKPNTNGPDPYYSTQNQIELEAALQKIVDDTLSCVIDVSPQPDQPDLFQVWIGDDQLPVAQDCASDDGWQWTVPHSQIQLCGSACAALKQTHKVETRYFCIAG